MSELFNNIIKAYLKLRYRRISRFMEHPEEVQRSILDQILHLNKHTQYGREVGLGSIQHYSDYKSKIPLQEYNSISPLIKRMMNGEKNLLSPGKTQWFSKSSGTSEDKSKFIPVSKKYLINNHVQSSWDAVTLLYQSNPNLKIFAEKNLIMGGTVKSYEAYPSTMYGDISGIMIHNMPSVGRPFYTPDFETALLENWDEKIDQMVKQCSQQDVVMFGGVPTWVIVLFEAMLDHTGKNNILEIWPNVSTYIHGGVNIEPYKNQIKQYIPSDQLQFMEAYNASEGYFALQDKPEAEGMMLLLDNSIFYEFIPLEEIKTAEPNAYMIHEVELNKTYAIVISNTSGLYRYIVGDTVEFTSLKPHRIKIVGRIKHFINVFGEEVMVSNTDKALSQACAAFNVEIKDYTVAPRFLTKTQKGGHEWAIEFIEAPKDLEAFSNYLDQSLQAINSDYEAKRFKDMALSNLSIHVLKKGTFERWMRKKEKFGGQSKIPRLSNKRSFLEEIVSLS